MPSRSTRIFTHRPCFLRRLTPHTEEDQRNHEQKYSEEDHRPRCKLRDTAADRKECINCEFPVKHGLLRCIKALPVYLNEPMRIRQLRREFMKYGIAEGRHCRKRSTALAVSNDKVNLLARLEAFLELTH